MFFLCILFGYTNAQESISTKQKKADELFYTFAYPEAIRLYETISDKKRNQSVVRNLAESYRKIGKYAKSEGLYLELLENNDKEDLYWYIKMLVTNNKKEQASNYMGKYIKLTETAPPYFENYYSNISILSNRKSKISINKIAENSSNSDFGVTILGENKIIFSSSRDESKLVKNVWNWNEQPFLEFYTAEVGDELHKLKNVKKVKNVFSSKFHKGTASFNEKSGRFFFTSNPNSEVEGLTKKDEFKLYLYMTTIDENDEWGEIIPFPYNSKEYSLGHPALSVTGDTVYFASDMPGTLGGTDIFYSYLEGDQWSEPQHLKGSINTPGNEMFPYFHEGVLFFASDAHLGFGGLDVFYSRIIDNESLNPINLGSSINSSYDDFNLVLKSEGRMGYFSSNRPGGKGDDDIYTFNSVDKIFSERVLSVQLIDKDTNEPVKAKVVLRNNKDNWMDIMQAKGAKYVHYHVLGFDCNLVVEADEYEEYDKKIELENIPKFSDKVIYIRKIVNIQADELTERIKKHIEDTDFMISADGEMVNTKSDFKATTLDKWRFLFRDILSAKTPTTLTSTKNGTVLTATTIDNNLSLEEKFNKVVEHLENSVLRDSPLAENVVDGSTENSGIAENEEHDYSNRKDTDLMKIYRLKPIYFNFDKAIIRKEDKATLDKIVEVMNGNLNMKVEVFCHTDSRGDDSYNLWLSKKRLKSTLSYVRSRITKPKRIKGKGLGEKQLLNDCNKRKCTEEEHFQNRRTEFLVKKS